MSAHPTTHGRYESLARRIADDAFITFSLYPSLFEGLSGIGELMLDMFVSTGEPGWLWRFEVAPVGRLAVAPSG